MRFYKFLVLILLFNFGFACADNDSIDNDIIDDDINQNDTIPNDTISEPDEVLEVYKILAIGNSFSQDALEYQFYPLAKEAGIKVIVGNLYKGGASLEQHLEYARTNNPIYQLRKIGLDGKLVATKDMTIARAIEDEDWDFISFQEASSYSGIYKNYEASLPSLFNYVKDKATNPKVKYVMHQTWAYSKDSPHPQFKNYNNNQMTMYTNIVAAVDRAAKEIVNADIVVPVGTAIQNGRSSIIGDNFDHDGQHLDWNIGRYTAACTWFEAIFKKSVIGNSYKPEAITDDEARIAQNAAHNAVLKPKEITDMEDFLNNKSVKAKRDKIDERVLVDVK